MNSAFLGLGRGVAERAAFPSWWLQLRAVEANPKGYNFPVHVTKGHEQEAMEAQRQKRPSRVGKIFLKLLGFKGEVGSDYVE
jgi:hypothetical protein